MVYTGRIISRYLVQEYVSPGKAFRDEACDRGDFASEKERAVMLR